MSDSAEMPLPVVALTAPTLVTFVDPEPLLAAEMPETPATVTGCVTSSQIVAAVCAGEIQTGLVNHYYLWEKIAEEGEQADLPHRQPRRREEERKEAPGEAVVEVVDQAGLARRGQRGLAEAGLGEHVAVAQLAVQVVVATVRARCVADRREAAGGFKELHGDSPSS